MHKNPSLQSSDFVEFFGATVVEVDQDFSVVESPLTEEDFEVVEDEVVEGSAVVEGWELEGCVDEDEKVDGLCAEMFATGMRKIFLFNVCDLKIWAQII